MRTTSIVGAVAAAALFLAAPAPAQAFCGFYVSGAGADLFNDATQVVLMRSGTRTVLSMQNSYQGPPKDFALVVPVPVVLEKENVKTLSDEIFAKVDKLAAPRLVEYWEKDPCAPEIDRERRMLRESAVPAKPMAKSDNLGVTVEAKFDVGEYQVVILSAKESTGLDTWLREEEYKIPEGAEPYLRPYVEGGSKFFVAKVDVEKVEFEDGRAQLSPLRFYYDSEEFKLPIRLGMMNSQGKQDLIVHILAPKQRYRVANYENAFIPTNLDVAEDARDRFGEFYAALFDRTLEKNPRAVVTEYAWDASTCDPCPTPALSPSDLATLGADVVDPASAQPKPKKKAKRPPRGRGAPAMRRPPPRPRFRGWVLTRLHARYEKDGVEEDLVFEEAPPVAGGRERRKDGELEEGATEARVNNFQARYAIRHPWEGEIECDNPIRGRWGGPPDGKRRGSGTEAATDLAFVPRGKVKLARMVKRGLPDLEEAEAAEDEGEEDASEETASDGPEEKHETKKEKGCAAGGAAGGGAAAILLLSLLGWWRRRR